MSTHWQVNRRQSLVSSIHLPVKSGLESVFLHGRLSISIHEAKGLYNADWFGNLFTRHHDYTDGYVSVFLGAERIIKTRVIDNSLNPAWDESFHIDVAHSVRNILFEVRDDDAIGTQSVGKALLNAGKLLLERKFTGVLGLRHKGLPKGTLRVSIEFTPARELPYTAVVPGVYFKGHANCQLVMYQDAHQTESTLPHAKHYPVRGCWSDIYDAISAAKRLIYIAGWSVWTDLQLVRDDPARAETLGELLSKKADEGVRVLILVWDEKLSIENPLWRKASFAGFMQTHDEESRSFFAPTKVVISLVERLGKEARKLTMQHKNDAAAKKQNDAGCFNFSAGHNFAVNMLFTHHQKSIIVDSGAGTDTSTKPSNAVVDDLIAKKKDHPLKLDMTESLDNNARTNEKKGAAAILTAEMGNLTTTDSADWTRDLVGFIGGLDLTDGRYDTAEHALFSTLNTVHAKDFRNACALGTTSETGPREPWTDVHARITGPIVRDLLENFEDRWRRQASEQLDQDYLVPRPDPQTLQRRGPSGSLLAAEGAVSEDVLNSDEDDYDINAEPKTPLDHPFVIQLFRSIDERSAVFRETSRPPEVTYKKGRKIDKSIHRAYVHHIRRAKRFLYVENQYFLGTSHEWDRHFDAKCDHQIPIEIAERICSAIKEDKAFFVMLVIPMYPEGEPGSDAVQNILYWQRITLQMMYQRITKTLRADSRNKDKQATDYFRVFTLANREPRNSKLVADSNEHAQDHSAEEEAVKAGIDRTEHDAKSAKKEKMGDLIGKLHESRRFMIYVHTKLMIVDDDVLLLGSANINQRSMAGYRDSEIAMAAHQQPQPNRPARRGAVWAFRRNLFSEHLGMDSDQFDNLEQRESQQFIHEIAKANWEAYLDEVPRSLQGHLIPYPYLIKADGSLGHLHGVESFPDFSSKARVLGRMSLLPPILTT